MKKISAPLLIGALGVIVIIAVGYFTWKLSPLNPTRPTGTSQITGKRNVSVEEINLEKETIWWIPVEFKEKPRIFGETYTVDTTYLSHPMVFEVFLGGVNGEVQGGRCAFDTSKNAFSKVNNRWFIEPTRDLAEKITSGTKGQLRFTIKLPAYDTDTAATQRKKERVTSLIDMINTNTSTEKVVIIPNQICIAE